MRLTAGARVGPYEVLALLGAGGMGEVYRARDTRLGREVALKVISDGPVLDGERLQRFEQEARLAGSLNHPNLVVVHDVGSEGGAPFLVTELLEGESLRHRLSRGRLPLRTAVELGVQLAEGLAAAHARGIVHRDVKPENVFLTSGGRAKLAVARKGPSGMWIERPLGTKVWERTGAIYALRCSPDGEQLAFFHHPEYGRSELIVLDRSNTSRVVLTYSPGHNYSLAWTPDGKRLRFTGTDGSGTTLSSVSLHGDIRPLYRFPEWRFLQDISPDGTLIFSVWNFVQQIALMRPGQPSHGELAWRRQAALIDLSRDGRTVLFGDGEASGSIDALLGATDGTPPKLLGAGNPVALSPDARRVAMVSSDQRLSLVPTGAGATEEVPLSGLVVGSGTWSRDGRRLWLTARQKDRAGFQLFPVDVATRKLLEPISGSDNIDYGIIAISPDDQWIAAAGADRGLTVYPVKKGEPVQIRSVQADLRPLPAGWTSTGELWVGLPGATPPRLVRVELPSGKITRSIDVELRHLGGAEMRDVRITPDESLLAVEYGLQTARLELMKGIPANR